jgi:hypothetical protein
MITWDFKRKGVVKRLKGLGFWLGFEIIMMMVMQIVKQDDSYRDFILFFSMVLLLMFFVSMVIIKIFDRKPNRACKSYLPENSPLMILIMAGILGVACLITAIALLFNTFVSIFIGAFLFSLLLVVYIVLPTWRGFF